MADRVSRPRWPAMQPLRATREAIDELEPMSDGDDLLEQLLARGRRVRELAPDCVGLSLSSSANQLTFTLVASDLDIAVLDAIQYVDDGPCVEAVRSDRVVEFHRAGQPGDPTAEHGWRLFAEATAAFGVRSTLTLPILSRGQVTGSVNLYAASLRAFDGLHDELAEIFDAWAPGAVTNADLSFSTRRRALEAPAKLRAAAKIAAATGIIAAVRNLDEQAARTALRDAAACAGVDELALAEALLRIRQGPDRPS